MCFEKKFLYLQCSNKPIKFTVMEEKLNIEKKQNYKATIILKDEVIIEKFYRQGLAMETVATIRKLFPDLFVGGSVEEKRKRWEVIWTLGPNVKY